MHSFSGPEDGELNTNQAPHTEQLRQRFGILGLDGDNIRFSLDAFLLQAQTRSIAVLWLDFEESANVLQLVRSLYGKVVPGGFVMMSCWNIEVCRQAVVELHKDDDDGVETVNVDGMGLYWRKTTGARAKGHGQQHWYKAPAPALADTPKWVAPKCSCQDMCTCIFDPSSMPSNHSRVVETIAGTPVPGSFVEANKWLRRLVPKAGDLAAGIQHVSKERDSETGVGRVLDIPAFVVSDPASKEKRAQTEHVLGSAGFREIHFVPFVGAHEVNVTDMILKGQISSESVEVISDSEWVGPHRLHQVLSLIRNHVEALSMGVQGNYRMFGVFEDDLMLVAAPHDVSERIAAAVDELPGSADTLYLEYCFETCSENQFELGYRHIAKATRPQCAAAILFTQQGGKKALRMINSKFLALDNMYGELIRHGLLEAYLMAPPVMLQDGFWSVGKFGDRARGWLTHRPFTIICFPQSQDLDLTVITMLQSTQDKKTRRFVISDTLEPVGWRSSNLSMYQQESLRLSFYAWGFNKTTGQEDMELIGQVPWEKHGFPVTLEISETSSCWPSFECIVDIFLLDAEDNELGSCPVALSSQMLVHSRGPGTPTPVEQFAADTSITKSLHAWPQPQETSCTCTKRASTFGMTEFLKRMPAHGGHKVFIYSCTNGQICGGLADRMIGMVSVFMLAVLTNRSFAIEVDQPSPLQDFLSPNEYDWTTEYPDSPVLNWIDTCVTHPDLSSVNLEEAFPGPVVRIQVNMELFSRLRSNPTYAQDHDILHLNLWFPYFYSVMFKPSALVQAVGGAVFDTMSQQHVTCAQMRLLTNDRFNSANRECGQSDEECSLSWREQLHKTTQTSPGIIARGPADFLLQSDDVQMIWDWLSSRPHDEPIFVSSDSKGILVDAMSRFGSRLLVIEGDIAHLEHGPKLTRSLAYTFATFHAFQYCKSMILSRSGFGELGASRMRLVPGTTLILQTLGVSWRLDPCMFYTYKDDCGGWREEGHMYAGYEQHVINMTLDTA
jgi:hypothetical protein